MKLLLKTFLFVLTFVCLSTEISTAQKLPVVPADKSVVYFVRPAVMGCAINFTYFDSTKYIGKFNGMKYMRYVCKPGKHLFWVRSENKCYLEAELEAGKIYFVEVKTLPGALIAEVGMIPVDPKDLKKMTKMVEYVKERTSQYFSPEELAKGQQELADVITRGLQIYAENKASGTEIRVLDKSQYYTGD